MYGANATDFHNLGQDGILLLWAGFVGSSSLLTNFSFLLEWLDYYRIEAWMSFPPIFLANPAGFRCGRCWNAVDFLDARRPLHSNFDFVGLCFNAKNTIQRVFSLARKLGFQSFLVEELERNDCSLKNEEDELLQRCRNDFTHSMVYRISFFSSDISCRPQQSDFLGYAVIKTDFYKDSMHGYIYESVLPTYRTEKENNFLHCKRTYRIENEFGQFDITGALYAQQNGNTNVCAHVALRTVLSLLLPEGDISYPEMNQIAKIHSYPVGHLNVSQINDILNAKKVVSRMEFKKTLEKQGILSYSSLLYGHIESSCPSLWAFDIAEEISKDEGHIVPVLGHTFNEDSWVASANKKYFCNKKYYSSEGWLSDYLIHDDNFGPYFCVPRDYLETKHFSFLVGLHMENKDALYADIVEKTSIDYLTTTIDNLKRMKDEPESSWYRRLKFLAADSAQEVNTFVLRPIFIRRDDYVAYLENCRLEQHLIDGFRKLRDEFWMVEVSCPELFSATRAKIGEALFAIEYNEPIYKDYSLFGGEGEIQECFPSARPLAYRLPGIVYFENNTNKHPQKTTMVNSYTRLFSK